MSELGEYLKTLRGDTTQAELAKETGLSLRTIGRSELGYDLYLDTLRVLAKHHKLGVAQWSDILVLWVRQQLGEEVCHVDVHSKYGSKEKSRDLELEKFVDDFRSLPKRYQAELKLAVKREEVLRSMVPINQLVTKLQSKS